MSFAEGLAQAELAERLGASRQTINAIETGKYDPSLPLAFALSRLFAKPLETMFFRTGKGSSKVVAFD
ncbi:MAG: helix-turn-helix transcriptional regulator [Gemmatimonadota bacterium]|nr:helix-turn-helix transcriptional regulator [Gemmatimonadota bacterium]